MRLTAQLVGCLSVHVWRRKTIFVGSMMSLCVLVFICIYYNPPVRAIEQIHVLPQQTHNVQFLADHPPPPTVQIEQLSPDIMPNLNSLNSLNYERTGFSAPKPAFNYVPQHRIVHLDFKGAPPKVSYLEQLFPILKQLGATGLLLEWEDMFPWSRELAHMAASNAYSVDEVKKIISLAKANGFEVIPLVQTFGHVEFALKLRDFANLREVPESPQALCPSLNSSMDFVRSLIDQVMEVHEDVQFLHIGCDEVFQMGECSRCRHKLRDDIFLTHVSRVAKYVKSKYPNVTPIIWDDMLRQLSTSSLEHYNIGKLVEPMVWVYAEGIYRFVPESIWDKLASVFDTVWTASAFKGAFGETLYVPNVKRHLENNINWLKLMSTESSKFKSGFRGIVITGWQRYDHFAVLCELLPSGIPSLAVNLLATTHGYFNSSLQAKLNNALKCGIYSYNTVGGMHNFMNLNSDPFLWDQFSRCMFPGHQFFKLTYKLNMMEKEVQELIQTTRFQRGWMTEYNVRRNFSSPLRVDELLNGGSSTYHSVLSLVSSAHDALKHIFDKFTIAEWVEQKIYPMIKELEKLNIDADNLKHPKVWARRPFPVLEDLKRFGLTFEEENDLRSTRK